LIRGLSLGLEKKVLGEEHQSALTSMSNLGLVLTYEGKYNAFSGRLQDSTLQTPTLQVLI